MKITVQDCLNLAAFQPCIIAAGENSLDHIVRSVSVMDAKDVKTAISANGVREQLVLTSFYGMKDDVETQISTVQALAACGVSALVIFHAHNGITAADTELIAVAERAGLPLLIIPNGNRAEYADVIGQVMDKLLRGDEKQEKLINNTIFHLLDFDQHADFPEALRAAAVSNDFQVVLISRDFNPILVVETRYRTPVADVVRVLKNREMRNEGYQMYSLLDIEGVLAYWGTITIDGERYFLMLVDNDDRYTSVEMTKLAEIIELAAGMWRFTPERDVRAEFIKALIRGNKSRAWSLKEELGLGDPALLSVFCGRGFPGEKADEVIRDFEQESGCEILTLNEGEETYGLIVNRGEEPEAAARGACLDFFTALKELGAKSRVFHVTGPAGIEDAAESCSLLSETKGYAESIFPYKRSFSKYELVLISNCIHIQLQGSHIKRAYVGLLDPLHKEPLDNKARQLLDTLETFVLDAGLNSGRTARLMGIHANTVQYRLKKINELLGTEITGNRVVPSLTIALVLKRLERVIR